MVIHKDKAAECGSMRLYKAENGMIEECVIFSVDDIGKNSGEWNRTGIETSKGKGIGNCMGEGFGISIGKEIGVDTDTGYVPSGDTSQNAAATEIFDGHQKYQGENISIVTGENKGLERYYYSYIIDGMEIPVSYMEIFGITQGLSFREGNNIEIIYDFSDGADFQKDYIINELCGGNSEIYEMMLEEELQAAAQNGYMVHTPKLRLKKFLRIECECRKFMLRLVMSEGDYMAHRIMRRMIMNGGETGINNCCYKSATGEDERSEREKSIRNTIAGGISPEEKSSISIDRISGANNITEIAGADKSTEAADVNRGKENRPDDIGAEPDNTAVTEVNRRIACAGAEDAMEKYRNLLRDTVSFDNEPWANCGGGVWMVTSDGYLAVSARRNNVAETNYMLSYSASGSFEKNAGCFECCEEVIDKGDFSTPALSIAAEIFEETGVKADLNELEMVSMGIDIERMVMQFSYFYYPGLTAGQLKNLRRSAPDRHEQIMFFVPFSRNAVEKILFSYKMEAGAAYSLYQIMEKYCKE